MAPAREAREHRREALARVGRVVPAKHVALQAREEDARCVVKADFEDALEGCGADVGACLREQVVEFGVWRGRCTRGDAALGQNVLECLWRRWKEGGEKAAYACISRYLNENMPAYLILRSLPSKVTSYSTRLRTSLINR